MGVNNSVKHCSKSLKQLNRASDGVMMQMSNVSPSEKQNDQTIVLHLESLEQWNINGNSVLFLQLFTFTCEIQKSIIYFEIT